MKRTPHYGGSFASTSDPRHIVIRGRVESVERTRLIIRSEGELLAVHFRQTPGLYRGDIVEIVVQKSDERADYLTHKLLVRPAEDPVGVRHSMYHEMRSKFKCLHARALMWSRVRSFFQERGFLEIQTPSLVLSPGMEPSLGFFTTTYVDHRQRPHVYYLPTSPEFSLKKALCAGYERIYDIRPVFRNHGELGPLHHPEFTMLEWYRAYADYTAIMHDTEELVSFLACELVGKEPAPFRGIRISWEPPYPHKSVQEAWSQFVGIDLLACLQDPTYMHAQCQEALERALPADEDQTTLFHRIMLEIVEPQLGLDKPTILYDYPADLAALSVIKQGEPLLCERFELYIAGVEMANAFTELNDPREMALRIRRDRGLQMSAGMPQSPVDGQLLRALRQGMPPAGGIALGMDRLLMALLGISTIEEAIPFPLSDLTSHEQRLGRLG